MSSRASSTSKALDEGEQSETALLLTDRGSSSFDEDLTASTARAHNRSLSQAGKQPFRSLDTSAGPQTSTSGVYAADHNPQGSKTQGLAFAAVSTVFQAVMSVFAKVLGRSGVPVFEILLVRAVIVLSISYMKAVTDTQNTSPFALGQRKWLLVLRGTLGFGAVSCLYWSLQYLPLSDALVLTFLSPLLVAALSPVFNKELPSLAVLGAMLVSLAGVAMIAQPSFLFGGQGMDQLGLGLALLQALLAAAARIVLRELRKTETTDVIMVYSGTMHCACATIVCLVLPGSLKILQHAWQVAMLLGAGACAYGGEATLTIALRLVEAAPATAMSYLTVVWGLLLGFVVFRESPGVWELLGGVTVCSTTLLLGWDQRRQQ